MPRTTRRGRPPHDDVLTPTEWRIAHAIQHGMTNREIARRRGISLDAVKFHVANILQKLELADRQALKRWFRAPRDSGLNEKGAAVSSDLNLGRIGQVSRTVKDVQQAEAWYRDVLGLPHLFTFGKLAFFDCAGTRLLLTQNEGEPTTESILYLYVENIDGAYRILQTRGVEFLSAPHMIHKHADGKEEWMAFFKDPEGRPLAIMSQT
jgi:DNA-binding CsgD family transcriptional regulator/catechol 2,3-dioxygenase-like lactoylglutathione lyase family enzyme